jgi:hypothetical protein
MDESIISDADFDKLCKNLLETWDTQVSGYKKYISKADLMAGTGFSLFYDPETTRRDYPKEIIKEATDRLMTYRAKTVVEDHMYRSITDDPEELYESLKDSADWFLIGLQVDYKHFLKCNPSKQRMALGVIERILKERKNEQQRPDVPA